MSLSQKIGIGFGIVVVLTIFSLIVWVFGWLNYIDNYELGYKFDTLTGKVEPIERTGWVSNPPFVTKIHTIDLRPMQLCISANQRTLNCKLVKFNPEGLQTFLSWHGRGDYDIFGEATGSLRDIMKSYAFDGSGTTYPFLTFMPGSANMVNINSTATSEPTKIPLNVGPQQTVDATAKNMPIVP
ncbi:MAG TPA: hypothetical protein P5230_00655 [Candidatus Magasanikbacteria bacterium]|nr:hypothetical protein [Candidatus Magasanikbacteria bacterium]